MTVPAYKHENKTLQNEFARTYGDIARLTKRIVDLEKADRKKV